MDENLIFALALAGVKGSKEANSRIDNLPKPMVYKGTLGQGGTISDLPTPSSENVGDTYVVIAEGTYASQAANVGDIFVSTGMVWSYVPSGDIDTWRNIKVNGTEVLSITDKGAFNLVAGTGIELTNDNGSVTIAVKSTVLTQTLSAGSTTLTFTDSAITTSSLIDVYADVWYSNSVQSAGSVVLTFPAQASDMVVKIRVG